MQMIEFYSERFKTLLVQRKLSQSNIASMSGIPRTSINQLIIGKNVRTTEARINKLADTLQVPACWIGNVETDEETIEWEERKVELVTLLSDVSSEDLRFIKEYKKLNTLGKVKSRDYVRDLLGNIKYLELDDVGASYVK